MNHVLDVGHGCRAGTHTGDEATLLAQIVRRVLGVEHHRGVEVREEHDEQHGQNPVEPPSGNCISERRQPTNVEQRSKLSREVDDAAREDNRDNARSIHLQGDVGGLATHHLTALDALGIVHRDAALSALDEDDRGDASENHDEDERRDSDAHSEISLQVHGREDSSGNAGHDAHEDDERHAVADTALGDKFAHPHDEGRAGNKREHHDDVGQDFGDLVGEDHAVCGGLEQQQVADSVDQAKAERQVTRDLGDLATTGLAFLRPTAHGGNHTLHQLHDDRCSDVRHDAE